jgi:NTP pyrophosphatase (non-canonical NTP hydrolase)
MSKVEVKDLEKALSDFIEDCKRTENSGSEEVLQRLYRNPKKYAMLTHMALGMSTELGEIIDTFKRHLFYGEDIDVPSFLEETGDFLFYWYLLLDYVKNITGDSRITTSTILELNIKKRQLRCPGGYSEMAFLQRDVEKEKEIFKSEDR